MLKSELISLLEEKNQMIDEFKTATLSCITNLDDCETDLEKANMYMEFVELRQIHLDRIIEISELIKGDEELNELYESDDEDIIQLKNVYRSLYQEIAKMQPKMDELGHKVLAEMRVEFKKIKQSQTFNHAYFDSAGTTGTLFDSKQ